MAPYIWNTHWVNELVSDKCTQWGSVYIELARSRSLCINFKNITSRSLGPYKAWLMQANIKLVCIERQVMGRYIIIDSLPEIFYACTEYSTYDMSYVLYSTLLHLPPLRFHCVGGCWDRTHDCCDFGIGSQTLDARH